MVSQHPGQTKLLQTSTFYPVILETFDEGKRILRWLKQCNEEIISKPRVGAGKSKKASFT